jgi:ribosomal protein uL13
MASVTAKKLLNGEKVDIVNAENCVVVGSSKEVIARFRKRINLAQKANPEIGPKYPRMPHRIVKMTVSGMLPRKRQKGRDALKRLKAHIGIPKELEKENRERPETAVVKEKESYVSVGKISRQLGARW